MNNKGFTLIEVIICISLLAVIGVGSFFGIKMVDNKIRIDKLSQITDKAIEAAQVYIETNKEASKQLYRNSNGVSVPLQLLVNKGLLNIDNTDLTLEDLKDEYVVTFLGGSGGSESCEQITSSASWANDKPLFLCMNSDGESNLKVIDPDKISNKNKAEREAFYYTGVYADNFIKFTNNGQTLNMRIISVDTDDSLTVLADDFCRNKDTKEYECSFTNVFSENMIVGTFTSVGVRYDYEEIRSKCNSQFISAIRTDSTRKSIGGGKIITKEIYDRTTECFIYPARYSSSETTGFDKIIDLNWIDDLVYGEYLHLKPCMKIDSGTGVEDNPFILKNNCTN